MSSSPPTPPLRVDAVAVFPRPLPHHGEWRYVVACFVPALPPPTAVGVGHSRNTTMSSPDSSNSSAPRGLFPPVGGMVPTGQPSVENRHRDDDDDDDGEGIPLEPVVCYIESPFAAAATTADSASIIPVGFSIVPLPDEAGTVWWIAGGVENTAAPAGSPAHDVCPQAFRFCVANLAERSIFSVVPRATHIVRLARPLMFPAACSITPCDTPSASIVHHGNNNNNNSGAGSLLASNNSGVMMINSPSSFTTVASRDGPDVANDATTRHHSQRLVPAASGRVVVWGGMQLRHNRAKLEHSVYSNSCWMLTGIDNSTPDNAPVLQPVKQVGDIPCPRASSAMYSIANSNGGSTVVLHGGVRGCGAVCSSFYVGVVTTRTRDGHFREQQEQALHNEEQDHHGDPTVPSVVGHNHINSDNNNPARSSFGGTARNAEQAMNIACTIQWIRVAIGTSIGATEPLRAPALFGHSLLPLPCDADDDDDDDDDCNSISIMVVDRRRSSSSSSCFMLRPQSFVARALFGSKCKQDLMLLERNTDPLTGQLDPLGVSPLMCELVAVDLKRRGCIIPNNNSCGNNFIGSAAASSTWFFSSALLPTPPLQTAGASGGSESNDNEDDVVILVDNSDFSLTVSSVSWQPPLPASGSSSADLRIRVFVSDFFYDAVTLDAFEFAFARPFTGEVLAVWCSTLVKRVQQMFLNRSPPQSADEEEEIVVSLMLSGDDCCEEDESLVSVPLCPTALHAFVPPLQASSQLKLRLTRRRNHHNHSGGGFSTFPISDARGVPLGKGNTSTVNHCHLLVASPIAATKSAVSDAAVAMFPLPAAIKVSTDADRSSSRADYHEATVMRALRHPCIVRCFGCSRLPPSSTTMAATTRHHHHQDATATSVASSSSFTTNRTSKSSTAWGAAAAKSAAPAASSSSSNVVVEGLLMEVCGKEVSYRGAPPMQLSRQVRTVLRCVASALEFLHALHVVALDVKPTNFLFVENEDDGEEEDADAGALAKLSDFGCMHVPQEIVEAATKSTCSFTMRDGGMRVKSLPKMTTAAAASAAASSMSNNNMPGSLAFASPEAQLIAKRQQQQQPPPVSPAMSSSGGTTAKTPHGHHHHHHHATPASAVSPITALPSASSSSSNNRGSSNFPPTGSKETKRKEAAEENAGTAAAAAAAASASTTHAASLLHPLESQDIFMLGVSALYMVAGGGLPPPQAQRNEKTGRFMDLVAAFEIARKKNVAYFADDDADDDDEEVWSQFKQVVYACLADSPQSRPTATELLQNFGFLAMC